MAIRSFVVGPVKGLKTAAAVDLPNVVGIGGPNGAGKSTMLDELRRRRGEFVEPGTKVMFAGAHRTWRSGQVSEVSVLGFDHDYSEVLQSESIPGVNYYTPPGLQFVVGQTRLSSSIDEAQALVKTAIIRIRNKRRQLLEVAFEENDGRVPSDAVPDLFVPFQQLVASLVPHLMFVGIDDSNGQNIRCLFRSAIDPTGPQFDIDELSSGEKSAIALFLPFIESRVKELSGEHVHSGAEGIVPYTLLIDEPELHLHPLLQLNMVEYMRAIAGRGECQFIFSTQSPTLLDALSDNELYLLSRPAESVDNQLTRLVDSSERLELVREITGSTHALTRGKPIVFIEGERKDGPYASDEKLLSLLAPTTSHWAVVPVRSKKDVIRACKDLRASNLHLPGMPVFGLVDADHDSAGLPDFVVSWPVRMVENLLLDPDAIWELLEPHASFFSFNGPSDVLSTLRDVAKNRVDEEVRLRVKAAVPGAHISGDKSNSIELLEQMDSAYASLRDAVIACAIDDVANQARAEVALALESDAFLSEFHGKALLREWYTDRQVGSTGYGWHAFVIELARRCAGRPRLESLVSRAVSKIALYFPLELIHVLEDVPEDVDKGDILERATSHRNAWNAGTPTDAGRGELRRDLSHLGRSLIAAGHEPLGRDILRLTSTIGSDEC